MKTSNCKLHYVILEKIQVFFKAGVLAALEDYRDEKLSEIMVGLQSRVRWYLGMTDRRRRMQQRAGIHTLMPSRLTNISFRPAYTSA